ncbi:HPP family protein [Sulfolobus sp. S-194]|uniref:HPP family protein n=1 Tax=Sulfolobus sp. S-194 TaxID=2512240 RepID=UPI001436DA40|nr:HPP family protein [Sulfolobus sp. S-194]QIW22982.1 HPP family protein [Sulfolobus sp. S-194]
MNKKKVISIVNLITSMSLLTFVTIITHTEFILPPFLATAATKYPDPDWRRIRFFTIVFSYLISSVVAILFVYIGFTGLVMALLASFVSFITEVITNIEHPPSILACFLGVLEKVKIIYILHPVLSGVIIEESVNYILTKYVEPKLP